MKIIWEHGKPLIKKNSEVRAVCINCPNAYVCAEQLKHDSICCLTLYAHFTDDLLMQDILNEDLRNFK